MHENHNTRHRLHHSTSTFIPAEPKPNLPAVVHTPSLIEVLPSAVQSHHTRQDDDAMVAARATLLVSSAYIAAALVITIALLLIVFLFRGLGDGLANYAFSGLLLWGICILAALWGNRRQSLHHSATGLGHAEIESRERLARHVIDTHARLLLERWNRDQR